MIDRPKGYFPVPALKYLDGDYLAFVSDTLRSSTSRQRAIFNPEYIEHVLEKPDVHITPLKGSKLWQMAVLEHWLTVQGFKGFTAPGFSRHLFITKQGGKADERYS